MSSCLMHTIFSPASLTTADLLNSLQCLRLVHSVDKNYESKIDKC